MSTKKLLTYEGLEEYNIKWHERLQAINVGSIEDIFLDAMMDIYTFGMISKKSDITGITFTTWTSFGEGDDILENNRIYPDSSIFYHNKEIAIWSGFLIHPISYSFDNIEIKDAEGNFHRMKMYPTEEYDAYDNMYINTSSIGDLESTELLDKRMTFECISTEDNYIDNFGKWRLSIYKISDIETRSFPFLVHPQTGFDIEVSLTWLHPDSY